MNAPLRAFATLVLWMPFACLALAGSKAIPVFYGGEPDLDACGSVGVVTGLSARGDNFLTVRSGPGTGYEAVDRLIPNQSVIMCDDRGNWIGVVYGKAGADCRTSSPIAVRQRYKGPCKSGWVFKRFVKLLAG